MNRLLAATVVIGLGVLDSGIALADKSADQLVAKGEALGRNGEYRKAIDAFHAAEVKTPRAVHDCFIAVAHMRLAELTAARFYIDRCGERAEGAAPINWYSAARGEIDSKTKGFGRLDVSSPLRKTTLSLEPNIGFSPAAPATLWLPPGRYAIVAMSKTGGLQDAVVTVRAKAAKSVRLVPVKKTVEPRDITRPRTEPEPRSEVGRYLGFAAIGVGVVGLVGGGLAHNAAFAAKDRAGVPQPRASYDEHVSDIKRNQTIAWSLYAVSAAAIAGGAYLVIRSRNSNEAAALTLTSDGESATLFLSGRF